MVFPGNKAIPSNRGVRPDCLCTMFRESAVPQIQRGRAGYILWESRGRQIFLLLEISRATGVRAGEPRYTKICKTPFLPDDLSYYYRTFQKKIKGHQLIRTSVRNASKLRATTCANQNLWLWVSEAPISIFLGRIVCKLLSCLCTLSSCA